ncbi:MAG: LLM class flavin-dependent oxidoreductase [Gammaproteobacteria bacterium]|nr:LLM class flavin-dependent oxidoreductase [Gammaproteobacteria bacterium]MDH5276899.1 LLM class flavin-dependent oxidoreductase [Gammaproteobacteria bacterium]
MEIDIIFNEFASPAEAAELGLLAERYGLRGVWSTNYPDSQDPFFTLSLLASRSSKIRMGPLAISPFELHPLRMGNLLYALNELCGGRGMITVGGGGAVLQAMAGERKRMIRAMRECLEILRAARDGTGAYQGEMYSVRGYKLAWAKAPPPLIYLGSNHLQSMRLATRLADGLMTSDFCVSLMKTRVEEIHAALDAVGRDRSSFRISNVWAWHIKADAGESQKEARRELITRGYLAEQYFAPFLDPEELALVRRNFRAFLKAFHDRSGRIEGVPEPLVNKMVSNISLVGGLDAVDKAVDTLREFARTGVTEIALRIHDDPADAIRLIGERIAPALR